MTTWAWADVTATVPMTVRFDGDARSTPITDSLVDPKTLVVGDRVRVELTDARRVVVHGKGGGSYASTARSGAIRLATDVEAFALTAPDLAVSPEALGKLIRPLIGQKPTGVTVGSGSATPAADYAVAVAAASNVRLDGVFDGQGFDRYRLHWRLATASSAYLQLRFSTAGVPLTASNYVRDLAYAPAGSGFSALTDTHTALFIGSTTTTAQFGELVIDFPAIAGVAANYFGQYFAAAAGKNVVGGYMGVNNVFDGVQFLNSAGVAMSGWIKVEKVA